MSDDDPIFLARESYRRRRLGDAARFLPLLGIVLLLVPILWADGAGTSGAMIYIFSVWALLILVIGLLSRALARAGAEAADPDSSENSEH